MKKIILAVAVAAVAALTVTAFASASAGGNVARNQVETATLVVTLPDYPGNIHTYTIQSACGSFTGTGSGTWQAGSPDETITGSLTDSSLSFTSTYTSFVKGYTWSYDGPLSGGTAVDSYGVPLHVTLQVLNPTFSSFTNHGDYVSSVGGGSDAAHSCIGMPIH